MSIKFNKYHVTDGKVKVRVIYREDNRYDGRKCVTLCAKNYDRKLEKIFREEYKDDYDISTDYSKTGRIVLFEDHPLYHEALNRAQERKVFIIQFTPGLK